MSLGDFFPDDLKNQFVKRNIYLGSAILIKIPDFSVNYEKYIIVVAIDNTEEDLAYVVIYSEANPNVAYNAYLKSLYLKINKTDNPFLKKDSFVDCSKLREFSIETVVEFLKKYPERAVGNVSSSDLKSIHLKITTATTIEPYIKKKYGF